jgi:tetratricopeptide (TPR) repeat protein
VVEARPKNPFVGPRPFDRAHRSLFFGREDEVSELVSLIVTSPVVVLYAPSGAGKSSLLNAAVVPALERAEGFEVFPVARVRGLASEDTAAGEAGNVYVSSVISNWEKELSSPKFKRAPAPESGRGPAPPHGGPPPPPHGGPPPPPHGGLPPPHPPRLSGRTTLASFLAARPHLVGTKGERAPRAIVFDQFEEIITAYPEHWRDREGFFEQVTEALRADRLLRVVFAIREDYVAALNPFASILPNGFRSGFRLERLSPDAALEAVKGPIDGSYRSIDDEVASNLVADLLRFKVDTDFGERVEVEGEYVEPVQLQVVCRTLWSELDREVTEITEEDRRRFGNVDKALSRFYSKAIAAGAERAGIDEGELRRWFETFFITSMNTRGTVYRTPGATAGMPNAVIDELEGRHLIHAEWRARARWYELSHDRLIEPIRTSNLEFFRGHAAPEDDLILKASFALARAEAARSDGRSDDALKAADEALAVAREAGDATGESTALMKLADINFDQGALDEALELYEQARAGYEARGDELGLGEALRGIGQIHRSRSEPDQALDFFSRSLAISEKRADAVAATRTLIALLDLLLSLERYDEAVARAQQGLQLAEETDNAVLEANMTDYLGLFRYHTGDTESARKLWTDACERYDALGDSYGAGVMDENIGLLDWSEQRFDDALARYAAALTRFEEVQETTLAARVLARAADAHWYLGRMVMARDGFARALALDPTSVGAQNGLGQVLAYLGRHEEALEELDKALSISFGEQPLEAYIHSGRGLALGGLGRFDEALAEFELALGETPENAWAYYNRAVVHEQAGDAEAARADMARALEANEPGLSPWLRERAEQMVAPAAKA